MYFILEANGKRWRRLLQRPETLFLKVDRHILMSLAHYTHTHTDFNSDTHSPHQRWASHSLSYTHRHTPFQLLWICSSTTKPRPCDMRCSGCRPRGSNSPCLNSKFHDCQRHIHTRCGSDDDDDITQVLWVGNRIEVHKPVIVSQYDLPQDIKPKHVISTQF